MAAHVLEILHARSCPHVRLALTHVREAFRAIRAPIDIDLRLVCVETRAEAVEHRLRGSPTIRVDGVDVAGAAVRRPLGIYPRSYGAGVTAAAYAPPTEMIARALERVVNATSPLRSR